MSERDGWNHLYLYDGATGTVKNQITKGEWVVRGVDKVDEATRQIWFRASGMIPAKDPYFIHYYRINFDGTGLTPLTEGDGNHTRRLFRRTWKYYVDTWSRVDLPPVSELRRTRKTGSPDAGRERPTSRNCVKAGWRAPEVFTAKGRDGKTDIWGIIFRPMNFDKSKKVSGHRDTSTPDPTIPSSRNPSAHINAMQSLAELGFIVVQVDGMGTSNRSKAFHDVCWKNLGDAGFPDRILWHKAIAAKYPYLRYQPGRHLRQLGRRPERAGRAPLPSRNSTRSVFRPAAATTTGWTRSGGTSSGWAGRSGPNTPPPRTWTTPTGSRASCCSSSARWTQNVDPASTMQVVNALIKANKMFDLLVIPGGGHGPGGVYGERKRNDFFVHNLLGVEPPDWNRIEAKKSETAASGGTVQRTN